MRWVILAGLMLTACGGEAPEPEVISFRDRSVPIASQVDVVFGDLEGRWITRSAIGDWNVHQTVSFASLPPSMRTMTNFPCPDDLDCSGFSSSTYEITSFSQGRLSAGEVLNISTVVTEVSDPEIQQFWILWADADRRTLAIGNPEGTFGFILDREATGGEDRIAAARGIMEWMGYRVDEMVTP